MELFFTFWAIRKDHRFSNSFRSTLYTNTTLLEGTGISKLHVFMNPLLFLQTKRRICLPKTTFLMMKCFPLQSLYQANVHVRKKKTLYTDKNDRPPKLVSCKRCPGTKLHNMWMSFCSLHSINAGRCVYDSCVLRWGPHPLKAAFEDRMCHSVRSFPFHHISRFVYTVVIMVGFAFAKRQLVPRNGSWRHF